MLGQSQSVQHRQTEKGDQSEVGQHSLQKLGDKNRPDGHRRAHQEVHVAGKIHGLQQYTEAGQQNTQEQS